MSLRAPLCADGIVGRLLDGEYIAVENYLQLNISLMDTTGEMARTPTSTQETTPKRQVFLEKKF